MKKQPIPNKQAKFKMIPYQTVRGNETNTQEETAQDTVQQNDSGSETTESESVRTVTVTLNKNGGIFEPEWLETANEDPIATYLGTETNDIAIEDTGDTIVATVTDRDSISIPVALSGDDSLYFTGWDVSSGSYDADNETLTFDDGVDAYVLTAVYNSVADEDQQLIENKEIFDEQAEKNVLQQKLSASGISLYEMRPSDSYNQLDLTTGAFFCCKLAQVQQDKDKMSHACEIMQRKKARLAVY